MNYELKKFSRVRILDKALRKWPELEPGLEGYVVDIGEYGIRVWIVTPTWERGHRFATSSFSRSLGKVLKALEVICNVDRKYLAKDNSFISYSNRGFNLNKDEIEVISFPPLIREVLQKEIQTLEELRLQIN